MKINKTFISQKCQRSAWYDPELRVNSSLVPPLCFPHPSTSAQLGGPPSSCISCGGHTVGAQGVWFQLVWAPLGPGAQLCSGRGPGALSRAILPQPSPRLQVKSAHSVLLADQGPEAL